MKRSPLLILVAILLYTVGCGSKHSNVQVIWRSDTIKNEVFSYLPDTCIMDSDLFVFAAKLIEVNRLFDNDSTANIEQYKDWYAKTNYVFNSKLFARNIHDDLCFKYITDSIIPTIKEYGNNCTAANGEVAWLTLGTNLYSMFSKQETIIQKSGIDLRNHWNAENYAWLRFITYLLPLVAYEIDNVTGSSATYDIPFTYSKIIKSRTQSIHENFAETNISQEKSLDRLCGLITNIETRHWDWDSDNLVEDSIQAYNKIAAHRALLKWVDVRSNMAKCVEWERGFNNSTISLLDSISSAIYHIRH